MIDSPPDSRRGSPLAHQDKRECYQSCALYSIVPGSSEGGMGQGRYFIRALQHCFMKLGEAWREYFAKMAENKGEPHVYVDSAVR